MRLMILPLCSLLFACGNSEQKSTPFSSSLSHAEFPTHPIVSLTPGVLCTSPHEFRYPEKIAYCSRDVSRKIKDQVIQAYEDELGEFVEYYGRENFKVDHFIPLCMGGDNSSQNLWPQYKTIYRRTDRIEFMLCQQMELSLITQDEAISVIKKAKLDLSTVDSIQAELSK